MAILDIFNNDAFKMASMISAFKNSQFKENFLAQFFEKKPSKTKEVMLEIKEGKLSLVPFTDRGTAITEAEKEDREVKFFMTKRLAEGTTVYAEEVSDVRAFATESEFQAVKDFVAEKIEGLKDDIDITVEAIRLSAVQGKFVDQVSGKVIYNWFTQFGVTQPTEVNFALGTATTDVPALSRKEARRILNECKGADTNQTKIIGLCDDSFFDKLIGHDSVKETYLNQQKANDLRDMQGNAFGKIEVGGITYYNYRGVQNAQSAIAVDKCIFFPTNVKDNLVHVMAPANEFLDGLKRVGEENYSVLEGDPSKNPKWVRPEVYAYILAYIARPLTSGRGKAQ